MKTLIAARSLWAAFLLVGGAGLVLSALNSSPAVIPEAGLGIVLMGFATVGAGIASAGRGTPSAGCSSPSLSGPRSTSWRGSTAHTR